MTTPTIYKVRTACGTAENHYQGESVEQIAQIVFGRQGREVTVTRGRRNGTWDVASSNDLGVIARGTITPVRKA